MLGFVVGLLIGFGLGFLALALMNAAGRRYKD